MLPSNALQGWSIVNTFAHENGDGKSQGAYGWMMPGTTFADGVNRYTVPFTKGIGNYLEMFAIHGYVSRGGEAEVLDAGAVLGARASVRSSFDGTGSLGDGLRHGAL
jgi:hypothetical protein